MEWTNTIHQDLRQYVKDNHGFGAGLEETELYKKYNVEMDKIKAFAGLRVEVDYSFMADFIGGAGTKQGKIKVDEKGFIRFYEGKKRTKYRYLDCGLFDGFFAVLIPQTIREVR